MKGEVKVDMEFKDLAILKLPEIGWLYHGETLKGKSKAILRLNFLKNIRRNSKSSGIYHRIRWRRFCYKS